MSDSLRKKKYFLWEHFTVFSVSEIVFFVLMKPMLFRSEKEPWVIFLLKPEDAIFQNWLYWPDQAVRQ